MPLDEQGSIDWDAVVRDARVRTFHNDDAGYRTWVTAHPNGFIVTSDSLPPRGQAMIHTSHCGHVVYEPWLEGAALDGTPRSYTNSPKICADSERPLIEYCRAFLPADRDVERCQTCM
jgi:hypothetical protein